MKYICIDIQRHFAGNDSLHKWIEPTDDLEIIVYWITWIPINTENTLVNLWNKEMNLCQWNI